MADENRSIGIKILRGFLYVLSRGVIVAAVIAVLVIAYQTAVNTMTVNMIIKDAFAKRAQYALMPSEDGSDMAAMEKLFTAQAMQNDEMLKTPRYRSDDYTITSYYERTDIDTQLVWSWQTRATIRVTEILVDIKATSNMEPDENGRRPAPDIPEWNTGVYRVGVRKEGTTGSWIIDSVDFVEAIVYEGAATPTPDVTPDPIDEAAPAVVPGQEGQQPAPAPDEGVVPPAQEPQDNE